MTKHSNTTDWDLYFYVSYVPEKHSSIHSVQLVLAQKKGVLGTQFCKKTFMTKKKCFFALSYREIQSDYIVRL